MIAPRYPGKARLWLLLGAALWPAPASAQGLAQPGRTDVRQALDTEAVAPFRFLAAHGRRALVAGYASGSLEVWAYPLQIVSGYRVQFRRAGTTTPILGQEILRRVTYEADSVTRTYIGPDFVVREKLFVPLEEPGAILTYQVESEHTVEIEIHATPVLDLMWPGALGGQSTAWNATLSGFVLTEPVNGNSAVVGSPEIVAHDDVVNGTAGDGSSTSLGFTLRPDHSGIARVFFALNPPLTSDHGVVFRTLIRDHQALETKAAEHVRSLEEKAMRVETPDPQVNEAIAWAEKALDEAWVCNPDVGCGYVAGYGPSRGARRPQYDWFFAGDGLVAAKAGLAISDNERVRDELEFILRYQDKKTGMIWHELSQSAGKIDWTGNFPYMFAHVDISFQFLSAVEQYVTASGDQAFVRDRWKQIEAAYRYCRSIIDPTSGLPRIPDDKMGGNEQDRLTDDLSLSTSWAEASEAFSHLATLTGHGSLADEATHASLLARISIPNRYWSARRSFWVSGYNSSGEGSAEHRSSPADALSLHLFNPDQMTSLLDKLASASFQTDWGTRSVAAGSPGYDPGSYAKGSVWAVGTASLAEAFWTEHRPATALGVWRSLLPWTSLNSLGHMDEVLGGNYYGAQTESVPEQTWSSAGFLSATIHGLLGLNVDSIQNRIVFAPHLPAAWNGVSIERVRLPNALIGLALRRTPHGMTLAIDNPGTTFHLEFAPEIPLGSRIGTVDLDKQPVVATWESHPQEANARIPFDAPHGKSELHVELHGGVQVIADPPAPLVGAKSAGVRIVTVGLDGNILTIAADVPRDRTPHIQLQTDWEVVKADGAVARRTADGLVDLTFAAGPDATPSEPYRRAKIIVQLKP